MRTWAEVCFSFSSLLSTYEGGREEGRGGREARNRQVRRYKEMGILEKVEIIG